MAKSKPRARTSKTAGGIDPAVKTFVKVVNAFTYKSGETASTTPLRNLTFWVGAGFSKAWNAKYPTSAELFRISGRDANRIADPGALSRTFGIGMDEGLDLERVRSLVYQLDMQARYPDVRSRYVDEQNIRAVRSALAAALVGRFVEITGMQPFDREVSKFKVRNPTREQGTILAFFTDLEHRDDGSQGVVEGLRTHFISTNYDNVIETILDNIVGEDDSAFVYWYRGVSPVEIEGMPPARIMHDHWLVRQLIKINGGFEILRQGDGFVFNYNNRTATEIATNPPVVMLPSREQDYRDRYFRAVFPKAVRLLRETSVLVIVGYSLPDDDALMRFIIRQFAEEPEDGREKILFYVDPSDDASKLTKLDAVFPMRDGRNPILVPFNGTFNEFVRQYLRVQRKLAARESR